VLQVPNQQTKACLPQRKQVIVAGMAGLQETPGMNGRPIAEAPPMR